MPPILALSGPSSSGKTTIARLLRAIFPPPVLLIHQDDYYRPAADLPSRAGHQDWDSARSIDTPALHASLQHARACGALPPERAASKEDETAGPGDGGGLDAARRIGVVEELRETVARWLERRAGERWHEHEGARKPWTGLVVLDGFLLLGQSMRSIREACDLRILLRASRTAATARRAQRAGYVTAEGFWEDPPGYVDEVVWPSYVEEHGFLFEGGDVEGMVDEELAGRLGVRVCPGIEWEVERCLRWVVGVVMEEMDRLEDGESGDGGKGREDGEAEAKADVQAR